MVAHMRVAPGVKVRSSRAGSFSLVGLVVVVMVLALGVSLLVTSIGQAREAARRVQCSNNLKQIGLGIQNFHDIRQELPPSYLTDDHSSLALPNGFITWPILMMPFQSGCSNDYDRIELATPLDQVARSPADHAQVAASSDATYFCPTRRTPPALTVGPKAFAVGDYGNVSLCEAVEGQVDRGSPRTWDAALLPSRAFNASADNNATRLGDFPPQTLGPREYRSMTSFKSVTDGLAFTVVVGEKAVREDRLGHSGVLPSEQDGALYFGRGGTPADLFAPGDMAFWSRRLAPLAGGRLLPANPQRDDPENRFGSWHPGVTQFLMCDGSVKALSNDTATLVLQRLGCRNDGHKLELPLWTETGRTM